MDQRGGHRRDHRRPTAPSSRKPYEAIRTLALAVPKGVHHFLGAAVTDEDIEEDSDPEVREYNERKAARSGRMIAGKNIADQVVVDDRGRRRLHGAFTGGFSAGYYNTVDTETGWKPSQFASTHNHRHASSSVKQSAIDFMDDEDLKDIDFGRLNNQNKRRIEEEAFKPSTLAITQTGQRGTIADISMMGSMRQTRLVACSGSLNQDVTQLARLFKNVTGKSLDPTVALRFPNIQMPNNCEGENLQKTVIAVLPHFLRPKVRLNRSSKSDSKSGVEGAFARFDTEKHRLESGVSEADAGVTTSGVVSYAPSLPPSLQIARDYGLDQHEEEDGFSYVQAFKERHLAQLTKEWLASLFLMYRCGTRQSFRGVGSTHQGGLGESLKTLVGSMFENRLVHRREEDRGHRGGMTRDDEMAMTATEGLESRRAPKVSLMPFNTWGNGSSVEGSNSGGAFGFGVFDNHDAWDNMEEIDVGKDSGLYDTHVSEFDHLEDPLTAIQSKLNKDEERNHGRGGQRDRQDRRAPQPLRRQDVTRTYSIIDGRPSLEGFERCSQPHNMNRLMNSFQVDPLVSLKHMSQKDAGEGLLSTNTIAFLVSYDKCPVKVVNVTVVANRRVPPRYSPSTEAREEMKMIHQKTKEARGLFVGEVDRVVENDIKKEPTDEPLKEPITVPIPTIEEVQKSNRSRKALWRPDTTTIGAKNELLATLFKGRAFQKGGIYTCTGQEERLDEAGNIILRQGPQTKVEQLKVEREGSPGAASSKLSREEFQRLYPPPRVTQYPWVPALTLCRLLKFTDPYRDQKIPKNARGATVPASALGGLQQTRSSGNGLSGVEKTIEFENRLKDIADTVATSEAPSIAIDTDINDDGMLEPSHNRGLLDESLLAALLGDEEED